MTLSKKYTENYCNHFAVVLYLNYHKKRGGRPVELLHNVKLFTFMPFISDWLKERKESGESNEE